MESSPPFVSRLPVLSMRTSAMRPYGVSVVVDDDGCGIIRESLSKLALTLLAELIEFVVCAYKFNAAIAFFADDGFE